MSATTNVATTAIVATFTDPAGSDVVGNYVAIIDWGDATPTTNGVITYDAVTDTFSVEGTHTYAAAGTFNMTVTIRHGNSPDATVSSLAVRVRARCAGSRAPTVRAPLRAVTRRRACVSGSDGPGRREACAT